jgi:predicted DNA-binding protein (MmcQ/YjbR family)
MKRKAFPLKQAGRYCREGKGFIVSGRYFLPLPAAKFPVMHIEDMQTICKSLPAVTEDIKWDDHLCFSVGGKMFLVTSPDSVPPTASFKVPEEDFEVLAAREGFMPAPYMARYKWVYLDNINRLTVQEWEAHIGVSYRLIAGKLSRKIRKACGLPE